MRTLRRVRTSADLLFAAPLLPIIWHMAGRWGRRSRHWRGLAEQIAHQLNLGKIGVCTTYLSRPIYLDVRASIIKRLRDCVVGMREFPPFRLDRVSQCLWRRGDDADEQRILLPPTAFAMLRYLVEHAGRLVTQDELLDALWPDTFVQP